jgi:hypothetical protein
LIHFHRAFLWVVGSLANATHRDAFLFNPPLAIHIPTRKTPILLENGFADCAIAARFENAGAIIAHHPFPLFNPTLNYSPRARCSMNENLR